MPTAASTNGKYCWRAVYGGDGFYTGNSHTNSTTECFTTVKQPSSVDSSSSPTRGSVVLFPYTTLFRSVSGGAGQPTPTGTVDFFLCNPTQVAAAGGDCSTGGTQIGGDHAWIAVT